MAQTGYTPISLYYSSTASAAPTAGNLVAGELAINTADGKLYYKDSAGVVQTLATKDTTAGTFTSITDSGNLTFTGTGNRIRGDFSTATIANRVAFQTSTTNANTNIQAIPNGTAINGGFLGFNNSDPTNAAFVGIATAGGTEARLTSGITGTGTYLPLTMYTGGSERLRIDTSGNVGIGTSSPSAQLTVSNDASISGLTVGKGGGAVSTNSAFGTSALVSNTTGSGNTAMGASALGANTTTPNNTAVGYQALISLVNTQGYNTAVGFQAGRAFVGTTDLGEVFLGQGTGYSTTTGISNTFVGGASGYSNTTGGANASLGAATLNQNTTGNNHVAVGWSALRQNTTGGNNTALGYQSLYSNTTASNNTAVGYQAGYSSTAASQTFVGFQAGYNVSTGQQNTLLGYACATYGTNNLTTGNYCVGIGSINFGSATADYQIVIGTPGSIGKGGSSGYINPQGGSMYQGSNSTLWAITSDQRLKKNIVDNNVGLEKILQIKVRNFEYRLPEEITELDSCHAIQVKGLQLGPIAQELKEILPDCVKTESTGVMSVDASNLTWYLVNAIKELKAEIDQLKGK